MQRGSLRTILWVISGVFVATFGAIGALGWYGYNQIEELHKQIASLSTSLASTTLLLKDDIATAQAKLAADLAAEKQHVDAKLVGVSQQVSSVSGTVDTLQKLSKTDPELLAKYSKVFFLNEHYTPERVIQIPQEFVYSSTRAESISALVWPRMQAMLVAAKSQNIALYVKSAYRPFDEQKALKGAYTIVYGAGTANQFSADQGYSEHQLGTTADFISTGQGGALEGFDNTAAYQWMQNNAHRYGFVLSYPKNNAYYIFEPWHWRYVGVKLATDLYNSGKSFYDMDQRDIDAYLIHLFE